MTKTDNIKIMTGGVALLTGLTGSFLIVQEARSGLPVFTVMAASLLLLAGCALAVQDKRASIRRSDSANDRELLELLVKQLPAELVHQLRHDYAGQPTVRAVIESLGAFVETQQQVLNQNLTVLLEGGSDRSESLREADEELAILGTELAALEDQYVTDLQQSKLHNDE